MTSLKRTKYPQLPAGRPLCAVRHGDRLYVSGLTAFATDAQGLSAPERTQEILEQLATIAASEGVNLKALIKNQRFPDRHCRSGGRAPGCCLTWLDGALPACSLVAVSALFSQVCVEDRGGDGVAIMRG